MPDKPTPSGTLSPCPTCGVLGSPGTRAPCEGGQEPPETARARGALDERNAERAKIHHDPSTPRARARGPDVLYFCIHNVHGTIEATRRSYIEASRAVRADEHIERYMRDDDWSDK